MLLSIVMMVKNEERYLDKILNSLKSLVNDIESELIVLDTGSDDKTVEIAKKYTDKIYFEKWNDNFSEMRNKSISYASGEWILILDADEELINYDKMKDFFLSDKHYKYNCASIELKNIFSQDEKKYGISSLLRMFRNEKDFQYSGAIHEQPNYKLPIYNDIATFKHYGYMFENEEIRQLKLKRNTKILLDELEQNPKDAYINYQIGKNYIISDKYNDAVIYIENAYNMYEKKGRIPIFVTMDLVNLYIVTKSFINSKKLCLKYIRQDTNNIDIYYYLATSQRLLGEYRDSIKNYKKYLFLLENYNQSTQFSHPECDCNTIMYKNICKTMMVEIYYILEMYEEAVEVANELNIEDIKNIYNIVISCFYKLNQLYRIKELYCNIETVILKEIFIRQLENVIRNIKVEDRRTLFFLLSEIEDNYGVLNYVRLNNKLEKFRYKEILKNENNYLYGELIYYAMKDGILLEDLLKDISYIKIEGYINYLVMSKKEYIINFYNYLYGVTNTLEIYKILIYSCLSKSLLQYGNLQKYKYKNIFFMYINYRYKYIKSIYNQNLTDEELLNIQMSKDDYFVVSINIIEKLKNKDTIKYIKELKSLILNNFNYKNGIEFIIEKFENELNEKDEIKKLKKQYKSIVENSINNGELDQALILIDEYKTISKEDIDIKNMQGIIHILKNEYEEAEVILKQAFLMDNNDVNTLFNIAYLKEVKLENKEAISYYKKIISISNDEKLVIEAINKIKELENDKIKLDIDLYKKNIKIDIEKLINENRIDEAAKLLEEYKLKIKDDINIYSIEGIILLHKNDISGAYSCFEQGMNIDNKNVDLIYNFAYTNELLGDFEEAIVFYNKCLTLTDDSNLISDIKQRIEELSQNIDTQKYTLITIGINHEDIIFNKLDKDKNNVIRVIENSNIQYQNRYEENKIIIYEINPEKSCEILESIIRRNDNCLIICSDINGLSVLKNIKEKCKIVYYTNTNLYLDKNNYLDHNINMYLEKELCNICDFIITNNISVYTNKSIIEKRKVYLFNENIGEIFDINRILKENILICENEIYIKLKNYIENIASEYDKALYLLCSDQKNIETCLEISNYIYEKYNTEEIYQIYLSLLKQKKDYIKAASLAITSKYCDDIYKAELIYLNEINNQDLMDFIIDISIKNYKYVELTSDYNLDYKIALYNFELNKFDNAYNKYMNLLKQNSNLTNSPLVNRNISYLMYASQNDEYQKFYNIYKELMKCLNESECGEE